MQKKYIGMFSVFAVLALGASVAVAHRGSPQSHSFIKDANAIPLAEKITSTSETITPANELSPLQSGGVAQFASASSAQLLNESAVTVSDTFLRVTRIDQPESSIAPAGAGGVPFTNAALIAGGKDVRVSAITVQSFGPANDQLFESVGVQTDDGDDITDERRFDATHHIRFKTDIVIAAGDEINLRVVGSITDEVASFVGQVPQIRIVAIEADAPVVGDLPIVGAGQTINDSLVLGGASATLSQYDPNGDTTKYIMDSGVRFAGITLTADSSEDIVLESISFRQNGTAGESDVKNLSVIADGTSYAVDADGRDYSAIFTPAIRIKRGHSIDLYLKGDLTGAGAGLTLKFDLDSSDSVGVSGTSYGFGVGVAAGGNTDMGGASKFITSDGTTEGEEGTPFFSASTVTISAGSATYIGR